MLATLGDLVEDVVVWLDRPVRAAADTPCRVYRRRGGSAANVAAFAATAAAERVRFIGRVGDDEAGARLAAELGATGVEVCVERDGRTGTVIVLVSPDGERTMLPDRAASVALDHVPPECLDNVTLLHLPAYSLSEAPIATAALRAAAAVRAGGGAISVDASSTTVIDALGLDPFRTLLSELAPAVLFANADEADALALHGGGPPDGVDLVVVKQGAGPVCLVPAHGPVREIPVPAVARGGARDTTGAGDAFAAAFLMARLGGASPGEAARLGSRFAAATLSRPGASLEGLQGVIGRAASRGL